MSEVTWKPHERQAAFLMVPDSIKEVMYGGAAGGGKSDALLYLPIARNFVSHSRFKGIIFRRTFPELESELILRAKNQGIYDAAGGVYNEGKRRWHFPSGATISFGHMEYESDVRKHDSAEYNYIAFDELTSFTEYQYLYLFSRNRSSSRDLPAIIRSGTNPGNVGHGWVRARFVEPCASGNVILTDKKSGLKRIFIPAKVDDNPHLDPSYKQTLQGMAEKDRRAKLDGDWWTFSGQVFDDYREENFPGEPENAVHLVDDFKIPEYWPRFLSIDWGYQAMTYALWSALSPSGRIYTYREYSRKQTKIAEWAADIGRLSHEEKFADVVICQSAAQQRGDELTIAEQFEQFSGLRPRLSGNEKGSRVSGKLLLQEYFRWKPKPNLKVPNEDFSNEVAESILRNKGLEEYKRYLTLFEPETKEENLPKIQIFKSLSLLRKTIPLCVYDEDNKEDVAEFEGDDPYDCLRYNIRAVDAHKNDPKGFKEEVEVKTEKAVKALEEDNDWTAYHRAMKALESRRRGIRPIRLSRRRAA